MQHGCLLVLPSDVCPEPDLFPGFLLRPQFAETVSSHAALHAALSKIKQIGLNQTELCPQTELTLK